MAKEPLEILDLHKEEPRVPRGLVGLYNLGNSCYMNCTL
jgi:ubiquitin C-terminal hydrolase